MVPLLVVVLLTKFEGKEFVGLGVFLLAALTDFLDGYIARRRQLVTRLGNGLLLAALIVLPMLIFDRRRLKRHLLPMVVAVALSGVVVNLMKVAVDRERPPEHFAAAGVDVHAPKGSPSDRSFPSGHTQTAFGAATLAASPARNRRPGPAARG